MTPGEKAAIIAEIRQARLQKAARESVAARTPPAPAKAEREGEDQRGIQTAAQVDNPQMTTEDVADYAPLAGAELGSLLGPAGTIAGTVAGGMARRKMIGQPAMAPGPMALDAGAAAIPFAAGAAGKFIGNRMAMSGSPRTAELGNKVAAFLGGQTTGEAAMERFPMDQVRASPMPPARIPPGPPAPAAGPRAPPGPTDVTPGDIPQLGPRVLVPPEPAGPGPGARALLGERVFTPEPPMQGYVNRGPRTRYKGAFTKAPDPGPKPPGSIDEVGDTSFYGGPPQGPQAMVPHQPETMQNTPVRLPGPNRVPLPGPRPTRSPASGATVDTTADTAVNSTGTRPGPKPVTQDAEGMGDYLGRGPLDQIIAAGPKGANNATLNAARSETRNAAFAQGQVEAGRIPPEFAGELNRSAEQLGAMAPNIKPAEGRTRMFFPIASRVHIGTDVSTGTGPGAGFVTTKGSAARYLSAAAESAARGRMQLVPELQSWINDVPGINRQLTPLVSGLLASGEEKAR